MAPGFGAEIRRARERAGMSVEAAAAIAGLSPAVWRALEDGASRDFVLGPTAYVQAAAALKMRWTLVSS